MKVVTGARTGTGSWLLQRATAVVLALAVPALAIHFVTATPTDFAGWRGLFAPHAVRVLLLLTALALALHAWVGVRDIFIDYVRNIGARLGLLLAVVIVLAGSVVWLAVILWSMP